MLLNLPKGSAGAIEPHSARPPLERMSKLHSLLQGGTFPNCVFLAKSLEVSRKTIQRDLDFMRDRLSLPIAYDRRKFGFYYTKPVDALPALDVSEGELVALLVAQKALHQHHGTVYEAPLRSACAKIAAAMSERISVDINDLASRVFFKGESICEVHPSVFEVVGLAVRECRELAFNYRKLGADTEEARRIHPYHLGCVNNQWYVFGWDTLRQGMRTFALPRVTKAEALDISFERPTDFSIEAFLSHSLGVFSSEGKPFLVRIVFSSWAVQIVRERAWHSSQRILELPDHRLELQLELSSLVEVERWILSFGAHARVLEPPQLVDRIQECSRAMVDLYAAGRA